MDSESCFESSTPAPTRRTYPNPHALRHWFGSALREAGVDSLIIRELTGHDSLATTAIYVDVPLRQRASAVASLPCMGALIRTGIVDTSSERSAVAVRLRCGLNSAAQVSGSPRAYGVRSVVRRALDQLPSAFACSGRQMTTSGGTI